MNYLIKFPNVNNVKFNFTFCYSNDYYLKIPTISKSNRRNVLRILMFLSLYIIDSKFFSFFKLMPLAQLKSI